MTTLAARLWARVARGGPDECWPWQGYCSPGGHGQLGRGRRAEGLVGAHVAAWELANGRRPKPGMFVCHRCDNPPCCNPAHLYEGSPQDNVRDAVARGRTRGARGSANANTRLSTHDVAEIRRMYKAGTHARHASGSSATELGERFGITPQYVNQLSRRQWRRHDEPGKS